MSRYPGTQFRVFDNSQATASVPINNSTNMDDAVKYLATFSSVKGPEGITLSYGQDFYDRYGTQDNIKFNKYTKNNNCYYPTDDFFHFILLSFIAFSINKKKGKCNLYLRGPA